VLWLQKTETAELREKLHTITLADGISQPEAQIICECYFVKEVGCGTFNGIHDGGDRWMIDAKVGYGGKPVKGFYIDKKSGKITSPIGPSNDDPFQIFP
jgi:hypothetical protein